MEGGCGKGGRGWEGAYGPDGDAPDMTRRRCSSSTRVRSLDSAMSASICEVSGTPGVETASDAAVGGEALGAPSAASSAPMSPCSPR